VEYDVLVTFGTVSRDLRLEPNGERKKFQAELKKLERVTAGSTGKLRTLPL